VVQAQNGDITHTIRVLGFLERRVGAAAAKEFAEDLTPESEYQKLRQTALQPIFSRPRGTGRPTKKERRAWDKIEGV